MPAASRWRWPSRSKRRLHCRRDRHQGRGAPSPRRRGLQIDRIQLELEATIPGIDDAKFQEFAAGAKAGCPLSKALASVPEITLKAKLRS